MAICIVAKSASSALNKRADQRLTACAAFPEKLRGLLGSDQDPRPRGACRHCAGRPSAHVVRLLGHLCAGLRFHPRSKPGLRSWAAGDGAGCALPALVVAAFATPAPGAGPRERESGALRTGPGPPLGSGSGRVPGRSFRAPRSPGAAGAARVVAAAWRRAGQGARRLFRAESTTGCPALLLLPRTLESNPSSRAQSDSG